MLSSFSKIDALAVRYVNDVICIGLGSVLYIVNKSNHKLRVKLNVLYPERIHGITQAPDSKLIIFGGKSLRICKLDNISNICNISDIYHLTDWIIAVECATMGKEVKLIILFSHNNLYVCDLFNKEHQIVCCKEKCILYGGSIYSKRSEDVVVFSGTVFQEILVWKANIKGSNEDVPILHRLKGHNGVIFSVFYDPFTNLICSTSDDRTVRLWNIQYEKNSNEVEWETVQISLLATMYGHTARVWRAIIKNDIIVSIGEDSQICLWSTKGQFLKKIHAHHGAPIWSVDVSNNYNMMLTGASDGSIYAWPFPFTHEPEDCYLLENRDNKSPKFACCLANGTSLVIKDEGNINSFDPVTHNLSGSCKLPMFSDYLLMQVCPDRSRISLVSKDGFITIYQEGPPLKCQVTEKMIDSKIFSIQWLNNYALLVCGSFGRLNVVSVASTGEMKILSEYTLPESRERWTTAAIMYDTLLICGDRAGSIFVFKTSNVDNNQSQKPMQTFHKMHGKFGIQSFTIRGTKLITAGRDGQLRFYELTNENGEYSLELECAKNMPMDWINRVLETKEDQYVLGFSEIDFIVYSMSLRRILIRIPCGGGHRSWDCVINENILKFVFIRDKQVHLTTFPLKKLALPPIVEGYHVKEIYCMETIKNMCIFISGSEDCSLRVSHAIKSTKNGGIDDFETLNILDGHISNVKCLAILNVKNTEFYSKNLVFTGGGRAQLKVWELIVRLEKKLLSSEDLSCKNVDSFMLKGTDKERKKLIKTLKMNYDVDPETRYMDINVYSCPESPNLVLLFVACSDGYLRIFSFNRDDLRLKIENTIEYSRCILKVHSFTHEGHLIVLTMATDGIINFWNFSFMKNQKKKENILPTPFTKIRIHQSGINSFDLEKVNENDYLLVTGGDDNLLSLIAFNLIILENGTLSAQIVTKWSSSISHCAQISGVKFNAGKLYSTGTDQRVIVHRYFYRNMELSVIQSNEIISCVSDVQGITLCGSDELGDTLICTYGKGIEFLVDKT